MPDVSVRHDRVENLNRAMVSSSSVGSKGGIFLNRNGKLYTVNIRPSKWNDKNKPSKFWIGGKSCEMAKYLADTIYHYTGKPRFHFLEEDADHLMFPTLECIGIEINTPVLLTSQKIRSEYVRSIAGEAYAIQRKDFTDKVMNVIESDAFVLQGEKFLKSREEAAAPSEEAAAPSEAAANFKEEATTHKMEAAAPSEAVANFKEEATTHKMEATHPKEDAATPKDFSVSADWAEDTPPIEDDDMGLEAIRQSQLDSSQAFAPSFEIDFNGFGKKSLQSVGQSFGSTCFSMKDCPTTLNEDKEKLQRWMESVAKLNTSTYENQELSNDAPELEYGFDIATWNGWIEGLTSDHYELCTCSINTTGHVSADAQQLNNVKRQKIGDGSWLNERR